MGRAGNRRPRVLWIWHAAVVAEYQKPIAALAETDRWEMHLLVPEAWPERAGQMVALERRTAPSYRIHPAGVLFPRHYYIYLFPNLLAHLWRIRPDILHVYEEAHSLLPFLILLLRPLLARCWGRRLPVILYAAQNIVKRYPLPFRWFEAFCFRHADAILPCGVLVAATLRQKGYRGPLRVLPLPTDPAVFRADPAAGQATRQALGIPAGAVVIGYAGKLVAEKGVATLLRAFLTLPTMGAGPHLLIAGDGPLRAALEQEARGAGAGTRVHFQGALAHAQLVASLSAGDIWVVPSETRPHWREQFGRAAVEALACENAVVTSDSGELPRVVGPAGRVCPEGDAAALRAVLAELIADPPARAALARAGRARVLACYTPAQVAAGYEAVYASVCKAGRQPRGFWYNPEGDSVPTET
ncbi:MAG TPA: glycosyltransferase family 4 protein [Chloroflexia bacterium]|nr:glycosyltransferase family 4 protein [Chloroflexia bacterium]